MNKQNPSQAAIELKAELDTLYIYPWRDDHEANVHRAIDAVLREATREGWRRAMRSEYPSVCEVLVGSGSAWGKVARVKKLLSIGDE